jgi:hypothetical protein
LCENPVKLEMKNEEELGYWWANFYNLSFNGCKLEH